MNHIAKHLGGKMQIDCGDEKKRVGKKNANDFGGK